MAHSLSAKKRIRQNERRRTRNRARKVMLKDQVKNYLGALAAGDVDKAQTELNKTVQRLDKVAAKHTIHKNTAARRRSRLTRRLNALRTGQASGEMPAVKGAPRGGKAKKSAKTAGASA